MTIQIDAQMETLVGAGEKIRAALDGGNDVLVSNLPKNEKAQIGYKDALSEEVDPDDAFDAQFTFVGEGLRTCLESNAEAEPKNSQRKRRLPGRRAGAR
jgi:hypothetical protein